MNKGQVAFDGFKSHNELLANATFGWRCSRTPAPASCRRRRNAPVAGTAAVARRLDQRDVFAIGPGLNPDPGRVTIRRLNRVEYRNTIRDLNGARLQGGRMNCRPTTRAYGFDNIGDVLTISPMLLEKYMQAAETISPLPVPRVGRVVAEKDDCRKRLAAIRATNRKATASVSTTKPSWPGSFRQRTRGQLQLVLEFEVLGSLISIPGRLPGGAQGGMTVKPGSRSLAGSRKKVSLRHRTEVGIRRASAGHEISR